MPAPANRKTAVTADGVRTREGSRATSAASRPAPAQMYATQSLASISTTSNKYSLAIIEQGARAEMRVAGHPKDIRFASSRRRVIQLANSVQESDPVPVKQLR